jgi:hypothetical protein
MKVKNVNIDSLSKRQQASMKRHGKHHTAKHLREMVKSMNRGRTFTQSHKSAMRKVGK